MLSSSLEQTFHLLLSKSNNIQHFLYTLMHGSHVPSHCQSKVWLANLASEKTNLFDEQLIQHSL
jgi:hypothetical protein